MTQLGPIKERLASAKVKSYDVIKNACDPNVDTSVCDNPDENGECP
jgi:hypothetical protein